MITLGDCFCRIISCHYCFFCMYYFNVIHVFYAMRNSPSQMWYILLYRVDQKKCTQILIYSFSWTIGFYCAEFRTLNMHFIWNLFLNFVRDYLSKQLNMACYIRLVTFTLFKIDAKITKIFFCCSFHSDF